MNRYSGHLDREIKSYCETENNLICSRGASSIIDKICQKHGETIQFIDNRLKLKPVKFNFHGKLRSIQRNAVENCLSRNFGVLKESTGSGKSVLCLYMIAKRKQPTLILVHTKILLYQWLENIERFLKIPKGDIGVVGDGRFKIDEKITVGTIQSVAKEIIKIKHHIGYVVIAECHRIVSEQYWKTL